MDSNFFILSETFKKSSESKKWLLKFFILIAITLLSSYLTVQSLDLRTLIGDWDLSESEKNQVPVFAKIFMTFLGIFSTIFSLIFHYIFFFIISKIVKANVTPLSIFATTNLLHLVIAIISFISILIQVIFNLSIEDYNLLSLNIFDKGNEFLSNFNIIILVQSYLVFIILNINIKLNLNISALISVIYLTFNFLINYL